MAGWPRLLPLRIDDLQAVQRQPRQRKGVGSGLREQPPGIPQPAFPTTTRPHRGGWPSPRSWESLAKCQAICDVAGADDAVRMLIAAALVGEGAAVEYMSYVRDLDLPDPLDLLADPDSFGQAEAD